MLPLPKGAVRRIELEGAVHNIGCRNDRELVGIVNEETTLADRNIKYTPTFSQIWPKYQRDELHDKFGTVEAVSPLGDFALQHGGKHKDIEIVDLNTAVKKMTLALDPAELEWAEFSEDGKKVYAYEIKKDPNNPEKKIHTTRLFDSRTGENYANVEETFKPQWVSRDGSLMVAKRSDQGNAPYELIEVKTGKMVVGPIVKHPTASSPDGKQLALTFYNPAEGPGAEIVRVYSLPTMAPLYERKTASRPQISFSRDSLQLVIKDEEKMQLVESRSGKTIKELPAPESDTSPGEVHFCGDSRFFFTEEDTINPSSHSILVWDTAKVLGATLPAPAHITPSRLAEDLISKDAEIAWRAALRLKLSKTPASDVRALLKREPEHALTGTEWRRLHQIFDKQELGLDYKTREAASHDLERLADKASLRDLKTYLLEAVERASKSRDLEIKIRIGPVQRILGERGQEASSDIVEDRLSSLER